jgi:hypothetical protein
MQKTIRWRWGVVAAALMAAVSLVPQAALCRARGREWRGAYAYFYSDEPAYAAYLNALVEGRPRRNDPYTGRDERPDAPQPESLFSIQFVPAYLIALPARLAHVSAQTAFIILSCLVAFASALIIFRLLASVTGHSSAAAAVGAALVLCCGSLARTPIVVRLFDLAHAPPLYFPFLRSYLPALPFPFFFLFCALVWAALAHERQRTALIYSLCAGLLFVLLIFSYFYLWTTAAAWLCTLFVLYLLARPDAYRRDLKHLCIIAGLALIGLLPYWQLLARRAPTTDAVQVLTHTHRPDLFRASELIGALVVCALFFSARRGLFALRERRVLYTLSLALVPFVVFNQQVLTGRSLQPVHYEQYIANYVVLVALVIAATLITSRSPAGAHKQSTRVLALIALCVLGWGLVELRYTIKANAELNRIRDDVRPAALRLAQLAADAPTAGRATAPVVLVTNIIQADSLPLDAPQAVLWAPHMRSFAGVSLTEERERYYQQLYYTGTDAARFDDLLRHTLIAPSMIFGWARVNERLTAEQQPIREDEIRAEVRRYGEYVAAFNRERAAQLPLLYVVTPATGADLANLDRWYARNQGERVGNTILYRVTLR